MKWASWCVRRYRQLGWGGSRGGFPQLEHRKSEGMGAGLSAFGFRLRAFGFGLQASGFGLRASGFCAFSCGTDLDSTRLWSWPVGVCGERKRGASLQISSGLRAPVSAETYADGRLLLKEWCWRASGQGGSTGRRLLKAQACAMACGDSN
jgi:hypothetical protein